MFVFIQKCIFLLKLFHKYNLKYIKFQCKVLRTKIFVQNILDLSLLPLKIKKHLVVALVLFNCYNEHELGLNGFFCIFFNQTLKLNILKFFNANF